MSTSMQNLLREIDEAQARSMQLLLEGWQREIEAHEKTLLEARRKLAEKQAEDAAIASSVAAYLQGLVEQARSGDDVTAIPLDVRVASASISAPSASALNALISEVQSADDPVAAKAQQSAAWAVSHGFVPHPGDLSTILRSTGVDEAWAQRFEHNAAQLDRLEPSTRIPQLQVIHAAARLELVRDTVRLLDGYTPERTVRMIGNPQSLLELPGKIGAPAAASGASPRMGRAAFDRMLNSLFV